jgi:hypothetical protein
MTHFTEDFVKKWFSPIVDDDTINEKLNSVIMNGCQPKVLIGPVILTKELIEKCGQLVDNGIEIFLYNSCKKDDYARIRTLTELTTYIENITDYTIYRLTVSKAPIVFSNFQLFNAYLLTHNLSIENC